MIIVNYTNSNQFFIFLSISPFMEANKYIFILFTVAIFLISLVLSIIALYHENQNVISSVPLFKPQLPYSTDSNLRKKLFSAFSELEAAKSLINNLDDLKINNIISEDSYEINLQEYELQKNMANDKISTAKLEIEKELNSRIEFRSRVEKSLEELKQENTTDNIKKSSLRTKEKHYNQEIESLNREISVLQSLIKASGTYDIIAIEK